MPVPHGVVARHAKHHKRVELQRQDLPIVAPQRRHRITRGDVVHDNGAVQASAHDLDGVELQAGDGAGVALAFAEQ